MTLRVSIAPLLAGACVATLYFSTLEYGKARPAPQAQSAPAATPHRPRGPQNETPVQADVDKMMAALPDKAPAKPKRPRKVLVLCKANGYVHSSIPLAAKTIEALGQKTGAWSTTITYDSASITADDLKQYDLVFLDNTTGAFLDDPNDPTVTADRRKALLDFVRSGKGLAGIHAAVDSYHTYARSEGTSGPVALTGTWPAFNHMVGAFFKFHWRYPTTITVKIDDPKSPIDKMFHDKEFEITDEIYTFAQNSYSLKNVHELTSIDYSKMSPEVKALEPAATKRTDGDYGLSWIRREGKGRVFIEVLGHHESTYANPLILEHVLAGVQYALGDLKADDRPTEKSGI
jgi:uncharacterized protein